MDTKSLIEEIKKLPPNQRQQIKDFVLAEEVKNPQDSRSLREVLSQSPFARMDFEPPESERLPVRPVEL